MPYIGKGKGRVRDEGVSTNPSKGRVDGSRVRLGVEGGKVEGR